MPGDADAYVLLSDSSKACVGGVSYLGWVYGEGVCGLTPDKRVTLNWYTIDDMSVALVSVILLYIYNPTDFKYRVRHPLVVSR